jgi:hypothetical protein
MFLNEFQIFLRVSHFRLTGRVSNGLFLLNDNFWAGSASDADSRGSYPPVASIFWQARKAATVDVREEVGPSQGIRLELPDRLANFNTCGCTICVERGVADALVLCNAPLLRVILATTCNRGLCDDKQRNERNYDARKHLTRIRRKFSSN